MAKLISREFGRAKHFLIDAKDYLLNSTNSI